MKCLKNIILMVFSVVFSNAYSQNVGINTETPNGAAILDIKSKGEYKGVIFPKIYLGSVRDKNTIKNPEESLIVYNTNKNLFGKESLVYWNGTEWVNLIPGIKSIKEKYPQEDIYTLYAYDFSSQKPRAYSPPFYGKYPFSIGDRINSEWTVIEDFTNAIDFKRKGSVVLSLWGGLQGSNDAFMEGSVGVFIDDELKDIKTFTANLISPQCYHQLSFNFYIADIPEGAHTLKVAIRNNYTSLPSLKTTYGAQENYTFNKTGNWNPIGEDESILGMSVLLID